MYAYKTFFATTSGGPSLNSSEFRTTMRYDFDGFPEEFKEVPLSETFFKRRTKLLSTPDGFMLCCKWRVDFFSTSELRYPNLKFRLRLISARPNFFMISDNHNVSLGVFDCSFYTHRIALKNHYRKERMDMLAYIPVEFKFLGTLAETFIISARLNQFIQKNVFKNAPVCRIAIERNTNAFKGSHTENPSWYQLFVLIPFTAPRGGQLIVDFDTVVNCCLSVTVMKAMNLQDDMPSIRIDKFENHFALVFDLTSIQLLLKVFNTQT